MCMWSTNLVTADYWLQINIKNQINSLSIWLTLKIKQFIYIFAAALASAGTPVGCILSGWLMDRIGRKRTLLITEIPLILGWIIIASASTIEMIYIGRVLVGLGSGMVGAPVRVYTSEVTQPHLRGMLSALATAFISFGIFFQYTLGAFLSWQVLSTICTIIPSFALLLMLLMPETPNYLVSRFKTEKAKKSLAKLRGSTYDLEREVDHLQEFQRKTQISAQ